MYEGLSERLLESAIPQELDLRVVSGFVSDGDGLLSDEIDCMIVRGEGEEIPYTGRYIWDAPDVLAVFEIKKKLAGRIVGEAFEHLKTVHRVEDSAIASDKFGERLYRMKLVRRAFSSMTGMYCPPPNDMNGLGRDHTILLSILTQERVRSIKIALGYDEYKTERGFRKALFQHLEKNTFVSGFSPLHFPSICISGRHSLVKINGLPYTAPMDGPWWTFYGSSSANPLLILLEMLWTRIEADFPVRMPWGDDLTEEVMNKCVSGRIVTVEGREGWEYQYWDAKEADLTSSGSSEDSWAPTELSDEVATLLLLLHKGTEVGIDGEFVKTLSNEAGLTPLELVSQLTKTRFAAVRADQLVPTTDELAVCHLPDGRTVGAENNTGRLTRWVAKYSQARNGTT